MRLAHPLVLVVLSAGLLATAPARADTGVFSVGSFSAPYSGGGLHVQFTLVSGLGIYGWTLYDWSTTPVAVDVWRRKMADPCTAQTHVAVLPWVNQPNTPFVTADIVDATVDPNATYQYFVWNRCAGRPDRARCNARCGIHWNRNSLPRVVVVRCGLRNLSHPSCHLLLQFVRWVAFHQFGSARSSRLLQHHHYTRHLR